MDDLQFYASNNDSLKKTLEEEREYFQAVKMNWRMAKCAMCHILGGMLEEGHEVMVLVEGGIIRCLGAGESYKYLEIQQRGIQDSAASMSCS